MLPQRVTGNNRTVPNGLTVKVNVTSPPHMTEEYIAAWRSSMKELDQPDLAKALSSVSRCISLSSSVSLARLDLSGQVRT